MVDDRKKNLIKTYTGTQIEAAAAFREDAERLAGKGYFPVSQTWADGRYGCGSFLVALLLCFILIGILVFIYMMIVKPPGTLTVNYEFRGLEAEASEVKSREKVCPMCAETIKEAAVVCRFCNHKFV